MVITRCGQTFKPVGHLRNRLCNDSVTSLSSSRPAQKTSSCHLRPKFANIQTQHTSIRPDEQSLKDGLWMYADHTIWVPDGASDLQLSFCIIAHTGSTHHRGHNAPERTLQCVLKWSTLAEDVHAFVRAWIHCLATRGGEMIPPTFGPAVQGISHNDLVQVDYIKL